MDDPELTVDRIAVGGKALGLDAHGRATFVSDAVPTERVRIRVTREAKRWAEGHVVEVMTPSPDRVVPPCPYVAGRPRCGGCDWQHVSADAQRRLRVAIVEDALRRIGKLDTSSIDIGSGPVLDPYRYRTGVRMLLDGEGRLAYRQPRSHVPFTPASCLVVHPLIDELIQAARFPGATEVRIRVGALTGERMAEVTPSVGAPIAPNDLAVIGSDELGRRSVAVHEIVADVPLRISAGTFFQSSQAGASAVVAEVRRALAGVDRNGLLIDAYAGGGLFSATVGRDWTDAGGELIAIESNPYAVADVAVNAPSATVVNERVDDWRPVEAAAVIADPSRTGLGATAVDRLVATAASVIVVVSCDAGSLGRDARLLAERGYTPAEVRVLDLFNQTSHVEVITRFRRSSWD